MNAILTKEECRNLQQKFESVAFGCNVKSIEMLSKTFRNFGIFTFQFIEYFTDQPIKTWNSNNDPNFLFFPFLKRLLSEFPFIPDINELLDIDEKNGTLLDNYLTSLKNRRSPRFKLCAKTQRTSNSAKKSLSLIDKANNLPYWIPFQQAPIGKEVLTNIKSDEPENNLNEWIKKKIEPVSYGKKELKKKVWEEILDTTKKLENIKTQILEYNLTAGQWEGCKDGNKVVICTCPILSKSTFYGYFIILYPMIYKTKSKKNDEAELKKQELEDELKKVLCTLSLEIYSPVLMLLHNSFFENKLQEAIKKDKEQEAKENNKKNNPERKKFFDRRPKHYSPWCDSNDEIEKGLYDLWSYRETKQNDVGAEWLEDSLIFAKKDFASPGMVNNIREIAKKAPSLKWPQEGDSLPCALIYGEPGSGKDSFAQLIPLFCEGKEEKGYRGAKVFIVNMAALKPNALVGPLLLGTNPKIKSYALEGILSRPYTDDKGTKNKTKNGTNDGRDEKVFILDELNSLDIDLQGIFLRILEQGEVTPLFDIKDKKIKHLLIGIVNEDPERSIKESELRAVQQLEEFVGKMFGSFLHDVFAKSRRLRPDLFYRLSRTLYIKLPSLFERREDIPILFQSEFIKEIKNLTTNNDPKVSVNYDALEKLMSPEYKWPGNIRQLQSVARTTAMIIKEREGDKLNEQEDTVFVYYEDVVHALDRIFKGHE